MKGCQIIIITFVFILLSLYNQPKVSAQNASARQYVKLIVKGVDTPQKARELSVFIQSQSGIVTARMDYRTKIFFGIFETSSNLNISNFEQWVNDFGFEPACGFIKNIGQGTTKALNVSDCDEDNFNNDFQE